VRVPIPEETLLDYWTHDLADGGESDRVEEHLFACGDCWRVWIGWPRSGPAWRHRARGGSRASCPARPTACSDGVHVRMFWLSSGELYNAPSSATTSSSPL
jgi:hypothetical protein